MLAASTTMNIVGSMGKDTEGESYAIRIHFNLSEPSSEGAKRLFDFLSCILATCCVSRTYVYHSSNHFISYKTLFLVLSGKKTWVSYHPLDPMVVHYLHLHQVYYIRLIRTMRQI